MKLEEYLKTNTYESLNLPFSCFAYCSTWFLNLDEILILEERSLLDMFLSNYKASCYRQDISKCAHILQNYFAKVISNAGNYDGSVIYCGKLDVSEQANYTNIAPIEIQWYEKINGKFNESRVKFLEVYVSEEVELFKANHGNYPLVVHFMLGSDCSILSKVLIIDKYPKLLINKDHPLYDSRLEQIDYNDWHINKYQILHDIIGDIMPPRISSVKKAI